ncbi:MAG: SMC-Scp complex subunit ScpB [Chloroflexi bacterium]|nr:SMC-Scp complex subunit ScpB [Chloroflexota bacterium]
MSQDGLTQENVPQEPGESPPPEISSLVRRVEALLFVAPSTVTVKELAKALQVPPEEVERALEALEQRLDGGGLILQRLGKRVQLVTAPDLAEDVERFLGLDLSGHLSAAALETLAIIAYRQPITRAEIEAIRGVNSDGVLRSLLNKGLIEVVGRKETVGRPLLYGTTMTFLQYFGLRDLSELPPLEEEKVNAESMEEALRTLDA